MSIGDLYHQLSRRTLWITHEHEGGWALASVWDRGPRIRQVFRGENAEQEANAERDRLNRLENE